MKRYLLLNIIAILVLCVPSVYSSNNEDLMKKYEEPRVSKSWASSIQKWIEKKKKKWAFNPVKKTNKGNGKLFFKPSTKELKPPSSPLESLPKFIKLKIFKQLGPEYLVNISKTNKSFNLFIEAHFKLSDGCTLNKLKKIESESIVDCFVDFSEKIESSKKNEKAFYRLCSFSNNSYCKKYFLTLPFFQLPPNSRLLTDLSLCGLNLKYLTPFIVKLTNLENLRFRNNKLAALPEGIGELTKLKDLNLSNNELKSLPEEIGNLAGLTLLDLSNNQLKSLPKEIGNLAELERLNLSNNQLRSLPPEIGNLAGLTFLSFSKNQIEFLPNEILMLKNSDISGLTFN